MGRSFNSKFLSLFYKERELVIVSDLMQYSKRVNFFYCDTTSYKDLSKFKIFLKQKKIISFDIIIDDGSHILSNILKNLTFFFKYLKSGGAYVIEDYKHPNYYPHLNDSNNHYLIDRVLYFLKRKKIFKSTIITKKEIFFLNKSNKKNIYLHILRQT